MLGLELSHLLATALALLVAATAHEYAHAYVAVRLGDPTPRRLGRLTLNPLAHLDPWGTLLLLLAGFGWAKPVPVNPAYFPDPRRGMLLVAAAGPAANLILLMALGALARTGILPELGGLGALWLRLLYVNAVLAVFNLLPVPPLDGSRILWAFLRGEGETLYLRLQPYGPLVLLGLLLLGWLDPVIRAPVLWLVRWAAGGG
ncbi:MAG: site-2 protease family protein [Armatimonadetes bacterium]|nr:site-2 protease family protein [Armatimonadota bacterium]MDW8154377.1 site-2 protease family protein [Armatimonadota bacterium]